jgi:DNA-binding MarR family transcriptional regulator
VAAPAVSDVKPVLGPQAKQAMRLDVGGKKRLKLIVLLAAFIDGGEESPSAKTLCERLDLDIATFDALLKRLGGDGFLKVHWHKGRDRRNVYELTLPGHRDDRQRKGTA